LKSKKEAPAKGAFNFHIKITFLAILISLLIIIAAWMLVALWPQQEEINFSGTFVIEWSESNWTFISNL